VMELVNTFRGRCGFCGEIFEFRAMEKHLESCERRKREEGFALPGHSQQKGRKPSHKEEETTIFHLGVRGEAYPSTYWMNIEVPSGSKLRDLDRFLKDTWVECCGHLSQFTIEGRRYVSMPSGEIGDRSMNMPVGSTLRKGLDFTYEYDFGTTTELALKVLSVRRGSVWKKGGQVRTLARNVPPVIPCASCGGAAATKVCSECIWEEDINKAWFCDACSKEHECGEEMLLPAVNSPRVGMCGYTG
jgi:hypothetical protein